MNYQQMKESYGARAIVTHEIKKGVVINIAWCKSVEDAERYIDYLHSVDPVGVMRGEYGVDNMDDPREERRQNSS